MMKNRQSFSLQRKRSKRGLKITRKKNSGKKVFIGAKATRHLINFYRSYDIRILENSTSKLISFFQKRYFGLISVRHYYKIPKVFSLKRNYLETLEIILSINTSIFEYRGYDRKITLDFNNCVDVDLPSLFLLQVCKIQMMDDLKRINKKLTVIKFIPETEIIKSKEDNVNKQLWLNGFIDIDELTFEKGDLVPIHTIGFLTGTKQKKSYIENQKGKFITKTVSYVNGCLNDIGYELSHEGKGYLDGILSEMLNNAEDHSPFENWYLTANYFKNIVQNERDDKIGELNFAIFNFGFSIFEGIEEKRNENKDQYENLNDLFLNYSSRFKISKDNFFTLLSLQEGVSRLKYTDESRGTGTIKFIKSFLELGEYENESHKSKLHVFSGFTELICENKYGPYQKEGYNLISLNFQKSLTEKQDPKNLKELGLRFPGTMLNAKIYLNGNYLDKKRNGK